MSRSNPRDRSLRDARAAFLYGASGRKLISRPVSVKAVAIYRLRNIARAYIMHYAPASGPVYLLADRFQCQDRTMDWSAVLEPGMRSAEYRSKYSNHSGRDVNSWSSGGIFRQRSFTLWACYEYCKTRLWPGETVTWWPVSWPHNTITRSTLIFVEFQRIYSVKTLIIIISINNIFLILFSFRYH